MGPDPGALALPDVRDLPTFRSSLPRGMPSSAAEWRSVAESAAQQQDWDRASEAFRKAGTHYGAKGDPNAAKIMQILAQRYETRVRLFWQRPARSESLAHYDTGRRLEPRYGCYIGAFIDREDGVEGRFDGFNGQYHKDIGEFGRKTGKRHAVCFTYMRYGNPFPEAWFAHLKEQGAAAQWVLQPGDLSEVKDDSYLRGLAQSAARVGIPVFVRFAGEMNGSWVPYHSDPERYKQVFQLVARVFHQHAPLAAMVWCPNEIPEPQIPLYYPGEEAVDWVGVNFYSVYFNNNRADRPIWWRNPADCLEYIYSRYATKHPILVGEYAASHRSSADGVVRAGFAQDKIAQLYAALPRRWPRVKAVHWFSMNALQWAAEGRRLNDYSLLGDASVAQTYARMIHSPYFLEQVRKGSQASEELVLLTGDQVVSGAVPLSAEVKAYEQRPRVLYKINGTVTQTLTQPGEYGWQWDTRALKDGPAQVSVEVLDSRGKLLERKSVRVLVRNGSAPVPPPKPTPPKSKTTPAPKPTPAPKSTPAPKPSSLTLGQLLETAKAEGVRVEITPGEQIKRGQGVRFTLTAQQRGWPVLLLLSEGKPAQWLGATTLVETELKPGETFSVPARPGRVLRPDEAGEYTIRAFLLPSRAAAVALADVVQKGIPPPQWNERLVPEGVAYRADARLTVTP